MPILHRGKTTGDKEDLGEQMAKVAEAMLQMGTFMSEAQLKKKCDPGRFQRAGDLTVKNMEVKEDAINAIVKGTSAPEYPADHDAVAALFSPCVSSNTSSLV